MNNDNFTFYLKIFMNTNQKNNLKKFSLDIKYALWKQLK